ncbi:MAG: M28 family metallopeptidase [Balneolaceae bacterium]
MLKSFLKISLLILCLPLLLNQSSIAQDFDPDSYKEISRIIINSALSNNTGFERLTHFVDYYPHRLSGSEMLEQSIDWALEMMEADGFDHIEAQPVMVPHWVRGNEYAKLILPYERDLPVLGFGNSIATPDTGITADVVVVNSFEDLAQKMDEIAGNIVLYNVPFTTYGETVQYRTRGAIFASRVGAVASLVRSVTPFSMQTLHTGNSSYQEGVRPVPHAAVTVEDANFMQRMYDRGETIRVKLYMEAETLPDKESRNVIAEIKGSEYPEQIITIGGHIDSWDVGQGAMDDAGGCFVAWEAARLIKNLGLAPKRTIRVVLWTNEENGLRGARKYHEKAVEEGLEKYILAVESDAGVFKPVGFGFSGSEEALAILRKIGTLLEPIESGEVLRGGGGADISPLMRDGVPGMGLVTDRSKYFWYHHTNADTIDIIDREEFNMNVATMALFAFIVADMDLKLPR